MICEVKIQSEDYFNFQLENVEVLNNIEERIIQIADVHTREEYGERRIMMLKVQSVTVSLILSPFTLHYTLSTILSYIFIFYLWTLGSEHERER